MFNDSISDMLTRLRNALRAKKREVVFPFSKIKWDICKILHTEKYITSFDKMKGSNMKNKSVAYDFIRVELKYINNKPVINNLKRVSKPGCRIYIKKDNIPVVLNNFGIAIISSPKGLVTNKQAKELGIGGELICEVY